MVERHTYHTMFPFSPGAGMQVNVEYVRASDYDALAAELAEREKHLTYARQQALLGADRIRELEAALKEAVMYDYGDYYPPWFEKANALLTPMETPAEPVKWIPCWCPYCGEPHSPAVRETKDG